MYIPSAFAEPRLDVLHAFIASHAFATLVTGGERGMLASHVPVVLLPSRGKFGTLQFHLAQANPHCEDLSAGAEALAIFRGPHGYVSPSWYATTAPSVPTWNYVVVHAYGTPRLIDDDAALREHLDALVAAYEPASPDGWDSGRLPADVLEALSRGIVGFEIPIARLEGKWKLGQNRTMADRVGAITGLRATGTPDDATLADWMARTIESPAPRED